MSKRRKAKAQRAAKQAPFCASSEAQRAAKQAPFCASSEDRNAANPAALRPIPPKSTGPRTPEGKAISAMNALQHGFTSRNIIVMPGQEPDFQRLQSQLSAQIRPEGALEESLFHHLLRDAWTLHRVELRQVEMAASGTAQRAPSAPPNASEPSELSSRTAAPFCALRIDPLFDPECQTEFDRLERYHSRYQSSFHRSLRELRALQTTRVVQTLLPEPLGQGGLPATVKATEIIALAKRTHKYFNSLAINTLISASERSRDSFEAQSKRNNGPQPVSHKQLLAKKEDRTR